MWIEKVRPLKMKIGTHPEDDLGQVRAAREAIMPHVHSSAFTQAHQRRMVDAL